MSAAPLLARLPDGRRHFQHGPIDLLIEAEGDRAEVEAAYAQAEAAFPDILPRLAAELPLLRRPVSDETPRGPVAQRMRWACLPFADTAFITPMAAVAGAVADQMLAALTTRRRLAKAYVNNGGDIAFHLTGDACLTAGLVANDETLEAAGTVRLDAAQPARGLATSGRGGRSFSLGIADAVTVLAATAAAADAAATLIANATDCDDPAIRRAPAHSLDPDSDLGDRLVATQVGPLPAATIDRALDAGAGLAAWCCAQGLIEAAVLSLKGARRAVGPLAAPNTTSSPRSLSA
ncbi:MAG: UPF0280 family protein [Alphaproteobacteria bacterium]|nr:UPF0280 family protein [Alphaproteobacteria bacterium]